MKRNRSCSSSSTMMSSCCARARVSSSWCRLKSLRRKRNASSRSDPFPPSTSLLLTSTKSCISKIATPTTGRVFASLLFSHPPLCLRPLATPSSFRACTCSRSLSPASGTCNTMPQERGGRCTSSAGGCASSQFWLMMLLCHLIPNLHPLNDICCYMCCSLHDHVVTTTTAIVMSFASAPHRHRDCDPCARAAGDFLNFLFIFFVTFILLFFHFLSLFALILFSVAADGVA
jgi:hypothetical protein